jgi:hypothetical protein
VRDTTHRTDTVASSAILANAAEWWLGLVIKAARFGLPSAVVRKRLKSSPSAARIVGDGTPPPTVLNRPKPASSIKRNTLAPQNGVRGDPVKGQLPPSPCFIFSIAWSMVKLAARWRGGNSLKVSRTLAVTAWAPSIGAAALLMNQSSRSRCWR